MNRSRPLPCQPARRAAITLIEMAAVLACLSVIMSAATGLMIKLLDVSANADTATTQRLNLQRLESQFREDLHRATVAEISQSGPEELVLQYSSGETVHYRQTDALERNWKQGTRQGVERYVTVSGVWRFLIESPVARLQLVSQGQQAPENVPAIEIVAAIGLLRELPSPTKGIP